LVEYAWATSLPETDICREYVEWFVRECPCFQYGIMLMNPIKFAEMWGPNMGAAVELTIQSKGCPPLLWSLTTFIEGYDAQTDTFFDTGAYDDFSLSPNEAETSGSAATTGRTFVSGEAWVGQPPQEP
jgi:hypothetical protein